MESRWEIGGRQTRRNKRKRAKAAWPADIHRGHVNRNRVCDLVGHSSGQLNSGIVPSNVARILEAGGRGGDKTASKQRWRGTRASDGRLLKEGGGGGGCGEVEAASLRKKVRSSGHGDNGGCTDSNSCLLHGSHSTAYVFLITARPTAPREVIDVNNYDHRCF